MAPYEALYGRLCRSPVCWAKLEDSLLIGPNLVRETTEKITVIRDRILMAQSRQKSYANKRHRPLEFEDGDFVMLKVSSMKGVKHFEKKGKLAPRYIGSFKIIERIGVASYRLELPNSLANVHDVFHVSMLRKHLRDEEQQHVIDVSELHL